MERISLGTLLPLSAALNLSAQYGTAASRHAPIGSNGNMWRRAITAVSDATREITFKDASEMSSR